MRATLVLIVCPDLKAVTFALRKPPVSLRSPMRSSILCLELELVKVLAHLGELGGLFGIVGGKGLNHSGVQAFQGLIEILAALPLACLALQQHGLRQLAADMLEYQIVKLIGSYAAEIGRAHV